MVANLRLEGLTKSYGRVPALQGVDLEVRSGEFFAILGASAAGKTTTLRAIAGLEALDDGRVVFDGQDMAHMPVQGRGMAMIFQTFALYPHLSVRDNLAYPLRQKKLPKAEIGRKVSDMSTMLRIGHTLDRKPATMSGGEQQRLAIGRALIQSPELLLLDEPLTNLDAKLRHDTRAEFKRLHRELGMTMVYATPDQLEALSMGDRIAVLKEGRIVQTGTSDDLYDRPIDSFVATMVGAPPMNLIEGVIQSGARGTPTIRLPFAEIDASRWRNVADGKVLFGIRPHDLSPSDRSDGEVPFQASVHLVEPLGDVTVLDIAADDTVLKMVLPEEEALAFPVGTELEVALSSSDGHLFERESGRAI